MSETRQLRARIGPFTLESSDWNVLERTVNTICKSEHKREIFFAIIGSEKDGKVNADGLVILPLKSISLQVDQDNSIVNPEIISLLSEIKNLVAFGYVRTEDSIEPNELDFTLSIMIDRKFGRPIHYVIMNPEFEYEVYRTPSANLYKMLQPVNEDENVPQ